MLFTCCVSQIAERLELGVQRLQGEQRLLQAGACDHDVPVGIIECLHDGSGRERARARARRRTFEVGWTAKSPLAQNDSACDT
jgi:hypothetical protein